MFTSVNIQEELIKAKVKHEKIQDNLMRQAQAAIKRGLDVDEYIMKKLSTAPKPGKWDVNPGLLDKDRIFSIDDIKAVCIAYRLRFLDTKYFRLEELPYQALTAVKELEKSAGAEIKAMKIAAPAGFFKLQDRNKDPMLFARIDEMNYYLIYKWGNDIKWYKKWLVYPMRSIYSFFISLVVIGVPLAIILPHIFWHTQRDLIYYERLFGAIVVVYTMFAMVFVGFTWYKHFSQVCWRSPYFN